MTCQAKYADLPSRIDAATGRRLVRRFPMR